MGPGSILWLCMSHQVAPELQDGSSCPVTERLGLVQNGASGVLSALNAMPGRVF
jgi:hypothetical protein